MSYAKAWNCQNCPEKNGPEGCQLWWEILQTNTATGEQRLKKGCGLSMEMLPSMLIEVIKASNRPAAAVESCRNEIAQGFENLSNVIKTIQRFVLFPQEKEAPAALLLETRK